MLVHDQVSPFRSILALAAAVMALIVLLGAGPEPDAVPRRWQLDIAPGDLRIRTVQNQQGQMAAYFYLTYQATNNSGQDLLFAPSFELATLNGELLRSGRGVPTDVTKQLMASVQNPFVQDQIGVIGQLLQGKENARDGIVVWPANDLAPGEVTIYAAGFSGETKTDTDPVTKEKKVLRKTLMLKYIVRGNLQGQGGAPLELLEKRWIMR